MAKKNVSPLRYPGGKRKLLFYTTELIAENGLLGCTYVEPFAGGSGLALRLLFNNTVQRIILNDIDRSIYAVWHSILNEPDDLIRLIENSPLTIHEWRNQKDIQNRKNKVTLLELGFSTLFLNRTNRSGIILAGPIGGQNQDGNYPLSCRFNKEDIISKIREINARRDFISFYNMDATDFLRQHIEPLEENTFIFFDPPYHIKGPGLYMNHFTETDHENLANEIARVEHPWIVTYDNTDFIRSIYNQFRQTEYLLNYSAQTTQIGTEIMIFSNNIKPLAIEKAY